MRYSRVRWLVAGLVVVVSLVCAYAAESLTIVDVIPNSLSGETDDNSEPNIGLNPVNPRQAVISSFGHITSFSPFTISNPYFATNNGGTTWSNFDNVVHGDTTVDYGQNGTNAYMARLSGNNITAFSSANSPWSPIVSSSYNSTFSIPDQPWLQTGRGVDPASTMVKDRLYIGFNDLSNFGGANGKTATVRFSTDGGLTFANKILETVTPASGQDGPPVRVAVNGDKIYAAWARWDAPTNVTGGLVFNSTVMIRRDDNGATGGTKFGALGIGGNGVVIATAQQVFTTGVNSPASLGLERVGSDLSIAVDPKNANHVYVGFAEVPGDSNSGQIRVRVMESSDGGGSWTQKFTTGANPNFRSGLPALSVTADGQVGLMYTAFDAVNNKLEQHFVRTSNNFLNVNDSVLERFTNGNVAFKISPYLGDYMDLVAVGKDFYGVFSSSNNLNDANFPLGLPLFQRETMGGPGTFLLTDLSGNPVDFSVDPFFFTTAVPESVVPEPTTLLLFGTTMAGLGLARWKRRRQS
jgi:hypothetical protein